MRRIWPEPPTSLDEPSLIEAYRPDRTRPSVRVNFVASLDGAAAVDGYSAGLSGRADRAVFELLRMHCDALLVGAGTLRHEGYHGVRLDERRRGWRRKHGIAEYPTLVVVSASLDLDPAQSAFADAPVRPVVLTRECAPAQRRARLAVVADLVDCGDAAVDLGAGLAQLRRRGLDQVLCEGGPRLFGALLAAELVDELCLTVSPVLAGPGAGRIVAGAGRLAPLRMRPVQVIAAEGTLLTRYVRA